jgi:hypothetical protein
VIVTAKQTARKWVKERLKLHPGEFTIVDGPKPVPAWNGETAIFLRNVNDTWAGWFPINDINM